MKKKSRSFVHKTRHTLRLKTTGGEKKREEKKVKSMNWEARNRKSEFPTADKAYKAIL